MKSLGILFVLIFSFLCAIAQDGSYFLTHYNTDNSDVNSINFDIAQDSKGVICIANRLGVIKFDGKNWESINTPSAIFSLALTEDNTIYTGGVNGLGKIAVNEKNILEFSAISDSTLTNVFDVLLFKDKIYGINSSTIIVYDIKNGNTQLIKPKNTGELLRLSIIDQSLMVNTELSGLMVINDNKVENQKVKALANQIIEFTSKPNKQGTIVIGYTNNQIGLLANKKSKTLSLQNNYLDENIIVDGVWVTEKLIAITTLKGGIVFINSDTEEIEQIVNYQNGLPDNEIFALAVDQHNGLWVAHNAGLTRISVTFPFRAYDRYPGLKGELITAKYHGSRLYVGTSMGLYYLDEIKEFENIEVKIAQKIETPTPEKRKGIFGFLKRSFSNNSSRNNDASDNNKKSKINYKVVSKKELKSVKYAFKQFSAINSKVFQISVIDNKLFSGGLDGLFEIKDTVATNISNVPIRLFHASKKLQKIFTNTYNDKFQVFGLNDYSSFNMLAGYQEFVSDIFEDDKNRIWFCSNSKLFWLKLKNNNITNKSEYEIDNPYFYNTYGAVHNDTIYFVNESGVSYFNEQSNQLINKQGASIKQYNKNGEVWMLDNDKWKTLGANFNSKGIDLLNIFTDIKYISYEKQHSNFWVITKSGSLYKLNETTKSDFSVDTYDIFLKSIRNANQVYLPQSGLKFDQQNSNLIFEFVQPEYSGVLNIEYQYLIQGLNEEWSDWSSNYNTIPISYLPDGNYKLQLRSKNVMSGIKEMEPITFQIVPPYWKRVWFLALEMAVFALLLFLSIKAKKLGNKYQLVSRLLALLTLVIIIEFMQTIGENEFGTDDSPVFNFMIQVIVALSVLPLEWGLRKYVLKDTNSKSINLFNKKTKS